MDVIFNDLEEIFNGPGNQTLQDRVDTTINCRLDNITLLAHAAQGTTDDIKEGTFQTIDYQLNLRTLSDELGSSDIQNKLRGILYVVYFTVKRNSSMIWLALSRFR